MDNVPIACAVISFLTTFAFKIVPINFLALPVVPTPTILYSFKLICFSIYKYLQLSKKLEFTNIFFLKKPRLFISNRLGQI